MKDPIRILHVLTAMNYAGAETLLMSYYRNIDRQKVQFDFAVSTKDECAYDNEITRLGGKIIHYPKYIGKNHFSYIRWWKRFYKEHPEYCIIHGHIGSTAAIYLKIAKRAGRFTIAHSHSANANLSLKFIIYKAYSYPTRFIADYFFGCSKQALIDRYGRKIADDSSCSSVLNNAVDTDKFVFNERTRAEIRRQYNISPSTLVLGTVGRLTYQKNPFEIIRICKELRRRDLNYVFLWFGIGELYNDVVRNVAENELTTQIKLCGTRPDICNVLQAMDIFVFPSLWEGLAVAGVEAQAAGLPTLCSDTITAETKVTELCEFIKLNETSLWCDRIQEYANIVKLENYHRPNTKDDIVKAGYDVKQNAKKLEDFYLKILETRL